MCHHAHIIIHFVVHIVVNCCVSMFFVVLSQRVLFSPCKFYILVCMCRFFLGMRLYPKDLYGGRHFFFFWCLWDFLNSGNGFWLGYLCITIENLLACWNNYFLQMNFNLIHKRSLYGVFFVIDHGHYGSVSQTTRLSCIIYRYMF